MERLSLCALALLFTISALAQPTLEVEATVTWADDETTLETIYIELASREDSSVAFGNMQDEIAYIGSNDLRQYIRPRDIERYEFDFQDAHYVVISTFYNSNYYMMPAEVDNKLRVLRYSPSIGDGDNTLFETDQVSIRVLSIEGGNQGNNTKIFRLTFRRDMRDLFQAYPDFEKKVKSRDYGFDNWEQMVEDFNMKYGEGD